MDSTQSPQPLLLTIPEVCDALRVGRTTVYRFVSDGQLRTIHLGRSVRINADDVRALVRELTEQTESAA